MESTYCDHVIETMDQLPTDTFSQSCPDEINMFGDPLVSPRLGNDFQADIPSMESEIGYPLPLVKSAKSKLVNVSASFPMGLPIPATQICELHCLEFQGMGSLHNPSGSTGTIDLNGSVKCTNSKKKEIEKGLSINHQTVNHEKMKSSNFEHQEIVETSFYHQCLCRDCSLCRSAKLWTEHEADVLLLSLFIFGKDFVQIKKLLGNKDLGDILSFYYGRFYRSDKYNRWSDCRKVSGKKCVLGDRIFTGWRLQELLNRLLPHVSSKYKEEFLQVSDSFVEGTTSMDEYVLYIGNKVGTHALVEAIGIGKGKQDLTGSSVNHARHPRAYPEIPTIKDFSSFTSKEIVKFLTGELKLTKARSNDLFWEAVWPRLLMKGWRIKQSQNLATAASGNCSTFLAPGATKLSRIKRVKGKHYFESISDMLDKVASEPKLLELEDEATKTNGCKEISSRMPNQMNYTVVDTSLILGGKSSNFKQLRCLPIKLTIRSNLTDRSRKSESKNCKDLPDGFELKAAKVRLSDERNTGAHNEQRSKISRIKSPKPTVLRTDRLNETKKLINQVVDVVSRDASYCLQDEHEPCAADAFARNQHKKNLSHQESMCHSLGSLRNMKNCSSAEIKIEKKSEDGITNMSDDKLSKRNIKYQFSRRPKTGHSNPVDPVSKQKTSASNDESLNRQIKHQFSRRPKIGQLNRAAPLVKQRIIDIIDDKPLKSAMVYQFSGRPKSEHSNLVASPVKQNIVDERPLKQAIKYQFSRRLKRGQSDHVAPLVKRRRLTACAKAETSHIIRNLFGDPGSENVEPCCGLTTTDGGEKASTQVVDEENAPSISFHEEVSARVESTSKFRNLADLDLDISHQESEKSLTIELKGQEMEVVSDNGHPSQDVHVDGSDGDRNGNNSFFLHEINHHNPLRFTPDIDAQENKLNTNLRRQSKRNRQLTLRAMEALATGVLKI